MKIVKAIWISLKVNFPGSYVQAKKQCFPVTSWPQQTVGYVFGGIQCKYTCASSCFSFTETHRLSNLRYSASNSAFRAVNNHSLKMPK